MPVALEQFVKQLADSGVIAPGKLENFVPPKARPKDAQELARQLVQSKCVTKFQAREIYEGRAKSLILGNYTILDKIGAGGMGQVFKAEHRRMHRIVAIKMLPPAMMKDAAAAARFQREVEAASKLLHPNIVSAFDADEANGVHFLVMEYVEGSDLSALVKQTGPLSIDKTVNYILQAAKGLEFAHGEGVVHRDIKPANLLLDKKGTIKILDMGLARISGGDTETQAELTGTGAVMGTVDYMAPEQALSTKHADARADIYSLGCTLYYLISGHAVFDGDTLMAKLLAHREKPIPTLGPDAPDELQAVFEKMVAKKVENRSQNMSEVVAALEACSVRPTTAGSTQKSLATSADFEALSFLREAPARARVKPKPAKKSIALPSFGKFNNKRIAAIGAGLLGIAILAVVVIKLRTRDGTLVVEINQPNATVQVLDDAGKVEITQPGEKGAVTISVEPGKHRLKVEKDGFQFFAKDFEMESGGTASIKATLEPVQTIAGQPDKPWSTPAFQKWMKQTAALPAEKQVEAVALKLQELNPGFDVKVAPKIENGVVTELQFVSDNVTVADISPVRALGALKVLTCQGGKLADLLPLRGMPLTSLHCYLARVSDLSPLKGMPLTCLDCNGTQVSDLSPLKGMPLTDLRLANTKVTDLSPLKGTPLTRLDCYGTGVSDLSPLKGMRLTYLSCDGTKITDLSPLKGMKLSLLHCARTRIADLSPLKGMHLTEIFCSDTQVSDLSPLQGTPLTHFHCINTLVSDLAPLKGMRLTMLWFGETQVADLSALKGMPLRFLGCNDTRVSDLSPLAEMNLTEVFITPKNITKGLEVIRRMKSVERMGLRWENRMPSAEFWKKYDTGEFGKPAVPAKAALSDPAFQRWIKEVAVLTAEQQVEAVAKKLQELNPGFDGKETHKIANGAVTELHFVTDDVVDISPVRALAGLKALDCRGSDWGKSKLSDLSPLKGMHLTSLECWYSPVTDLSPLDGMPLTSLKFFYPQVSDLSTLKGMPLTTLVFFDTPIADLSPLKGMHLTFLTCGGTKINDLSPLKGMPLTDLDCNYTPVSDLSPLKGMHLTGLMCGGTKINDLSPLKGMSLTRLDCWETQVSDLSPLKGMRLTYLDCKNTSVSDLSPLDEMNLAELYVIPKNITKGMDAIRRMKSLKTIGAGGDANFAPDEFWKRYDAGEFNK